MALLPDIAKEKESSKHQIPAETATSSYNSNNNTNNNNINNSSNQTNKNDQNSTNNNINTKTTSSGVNNNISFSNGVKTPPNSAPLPDTHLPSLIFNDKHRSTAYYRPSRIASTRETSTLISSPLATNITYNWTPSLREQKSAVKSKSRVYKPVSRICEPARPPFPYKVNTSFESIEQHFHNEKRALEMKRWQYLREHTEWSIYPYAKIAERESYNKQIRETLKEQMDQKSRIIKNDFVENCKEGQFVLKKDKDDKDHDRMKYVEKVKYMSQYSVGNKQMMEDKWMSEYFLKRDDWMKERHLLTQDPINWSKTLK